MKKRIPTAPPNSGPSVREIIKYEPPAGTIPFVATALREMDCEKKEKKVDEKRE